LNVVDISPADLIDRSIRELASSAEGVGVIIERQRGGELTGTIQGDPSRLSIVLGNLLSNALKYTPRGGQIAIDARTTDQELVVAVSDTGPGVPPEHRQRVFERFFRVEHTRSTRSDEVGVAGVGIGLYIARQIVLAHGGTIACEASETGGGRFVVRLPLILAQ
jgi:signal transduction histidine kinase